MPGGGGSQSSNVTECGFCSRVFHRKQDYYEHNNKKHMDIITELWEGCPRCHKFYPTRMALNKHKVRYHSRRNNAGNAAAAATHAQVATSPQEETVNSETCDFCLMFFAKKAQYYTHVNEVHQDLICYSWEPCDSCFKYFPTRRIRDRHRNGFRKRGEMCTPNDLSGTQDTSAYADIDNSFDAENDSAAFAGPHFMADLIGNQEEEEFIDDNEIIELDEEIEDLGEEGEQPEVDNTSSISTLAEKASLTCQFCNLVLSRKQDFYDHANREHLTEVAQFWKGCSQCVRYYPTRKALHNHEEKSHRKKALTPEEEAKAEACTFCDMLFVRKDQFYRHANDAHTDDIAGTWISCPDCQKYFPTKHIRDRHRERMKYRGESCVPKYASTAEEPEPSSEYSFTSEMDPSFLSVEYDESNEDLVFQDDNDNNEPITISSARRLKRAVNVNRSYVTCNFCSLVLSRKQDFYDHANREHLEEVAQIWQGCKDCVRYYPTRKSLNNHEEKSHRRKPNNGLDELALKGEQCNYCTMLFTRREHYYRHVNEDHVDIISQTWISCVDCFKYFPNKRVHDRHREKFRNRGESCVPRYADSTGDIKYRPSVPPVVPEEQIFLNEITSPDQLPVSERQYITCSFCSLILQREQDYYDHANREHVEDLANYWEICVECSRYYPTKKSLYKHKRKSHREKPPQTILEQSLRGETCDFCPQSFTRKDLYYKHANDVHKDSLADVWVSCPDCQKYFPTRWIRDRHREGFKTRGESCVPRYASELNDSLEAEDNQEEEFGMVEELEEDVDDSQNVTNEEPDESLLISCDLCEAVYEQESEYYTHANDEHLDMIQDSWFSCDLCSKYFPTEELCNEHRSRNACKQELKLKLKVTPTVTISRLVKLEPRTTSASTVPDPIRPASTNQKSPFRPGKLGCNFCDQTFGKEQHYYRHVSDAHHEEASQSWFPCEGCYRLFPSKDVCYRHRKKAQLRGMPCNPEGMEFCEICNMSFARKETYYKHANDSHKDEITGSWVQCEECDRHYPSRAVLNSHRLWFKSVNRTCKKTSSGLESSTGHNAEEMEDCPYCGVSFPFGSGLMVQHINAIHPLEAEEDDDNAIFEAEHESADFENGSALFENGDDEENTFESEMEYEESDWHQQLQPTQRQVSRLAQRLTLPRIKKERMNYEQSSEVETLDDCLMEAAASSVFIKVKKEK